MKKEVQHKKHVWKMALSLFIVSLVTCYIYLMNSRSNSQFKKPKIMPWITSTNTDVYQEKYFTTCDDRMRKARTVMFNRLPKSGSRATLAIFTKLSKLNKHKFSIVHHRNLSFGLPMRRFATKYAELLEQDLIKLEKPWMFEWHIHFIIFSDMGLTMPLYINLARDPLDRFISHYYWKRIEGHWKRNEEKNKEKFEDCVLQNYKECQANNAFYIAPFFCGHDKMCRKPHIDAISMAKQNVEKYYGVVGLTEDLPGTFALLETTMPYFCSNMTGIAREYFISLKERYKTHNKPSMPSQESLDIMRSRLGLEYDFYRYIKQRYIAFLRYYNISSELLN